MPIELIAHTIRQKRFDFKKMDLQPVLARLPQDDGMVVISSPRAVYSAGGNSEVTLEGPVKMIGSMHGQPVVGRAESANVRQRNRAIVFNRVELLWRGVMNNAPQAQAREGSVQFVGRVRGQSAPAALVAAVYALPQPISFPPLSTELGFGEE
jgi:hypothetical protein